MASLRKRYQDRFESRDDGPAVSAPPVTAGLPAEAPKPLEPVTIEKTDPVAGAALKRRISELEHAEQLAKQHQPQQQRPQPETTQQVAPAHVQAWIAANPRYANDPVGQAELQLAVTKTQCEGLVDWNHPGFLGAIERHLGLNKQTVAPGGVPARPAPPPRQQSGPPVSAPVHRDTPSMTTGRPMGAPMQLTGEEQTLARSLGISDEEYREGKRRMLREKQSGLHPSG
jgi:hypothetical protein